MFNPFNKRGAGTPLLPDQTKREGRVIQLALVALGGSAAAMAFLNTYHGKLGGRPLDLAVASEEGLVSVERLLSTPDAG